MQQRTENISSTNITKPNESNTLENHPSAKQETQKSFNVNFVSGLVTGSACAGLFNPWDRALYLSIKENRPFLSKENFTAPYQGFSQALIQRAFLGGIYYIAQSQLNQSLYPYLRKQLEISEPVAQFAVGAVAGSTSACLTNSISAVKFHTWGQTNRSFFSSAREMVTAGGLKPFVKGTGATMSRDIAFGGTYEMIRKMLYDGLSKENGTTNSKDNSQLKFICNMASAGAATVISGPFNFARNMQYATPPHQKPPSTFAVLRSLWNEAKAYETPLNKARFFQNRMRVGWGTARVAVGMTVGQTFFDYMTDKLNEFQPSEPSKKPVR
ncbi:Mitochondrial carrier protein [Legionella busanensis]|uniref:Mitochondrial carrier protein n=1 Tax=Legionella busanensis TaxID=190655 RepID=A0A378JLE9_9GAMM|nr:MC/SLC25 family protein [Legionella busanensis]STX51561.1 Mitochondrial carrier protein [Legionella busanensis]